jgi:hypothetical protein
MDERVTRIIGVFCLLQASCSTTSDASPQGWEPEAGSGEHSTGAADETSSGQTEDSGVVDDDTTGGDACELGDEEACACPEGGCVEPDHHDPCAVGDCWSAPAFSGACGLVTRAEDFGTGLYNVHAYPLVAPGGVSVDVTLAHTGGAWDPMLIVHDDQGLTVHDGEHSASRPDLAVETLAEGVRITADETTSMTVFVTGRSVVEGGFLPPLPADATYSISVFADCESMLLSPPNFDPDDVEDGYHLMPHSEPPGLYTRKADDCARGTKLLIDVLYTVATYWYQIRPESAPITIQDMNFKPSCSNLNHATHDDGTHADIVVSCATQVSCSDKQPAIDLAKLVVDTGEACGILFNDTDVQAVVNEYFSANHAYAPWNGQFMRTVDGHTGHFHIRVKKPDGTCN